MRELYIVNVPKRKVIDAYYQHRWPANVLSLYPTEGRDLLQIYTREQMLNCVKP